MYHKTVGNNRVWAVDLLHVYIPYMRKGLHFAGKIVFITHAKIYH